MPLIILLYATWTSIFSIGKLTLMWTSPLFLTGSRMVLAGSILITFIIFKDRSSLKLSKKVLLPIFLLAILSMYLTNALEFWGLQHLSAAKTCFIYSLTPFFSALFSYIHFKEKMNIKKWIGMMIGFLGVIPAMYIQSGSEEMLKGISIFSLPELAIIGATIFSVYGWVLLRILVKDDKLSPLTANGISMLIGGILALIHSYFIDSWSPIPVINTGGFIKGTLVMTLISNIICYNLYGYLLRRYTATLLAFFGLLSPIFASITGWIFLGETPSLIIMSSSFIIIFGLWIVYKEEIKQGYIKGKKKSLVEVKGKND